MDEKIDKVAALIKSAIYDSPATKKYIDGAPHIKHHFLRMFYSKLMLMVYDFAIIYTRTPKILDLGAGEGFLILPFLQFGAEVTAVDISESRLRVLQAKSNNYVGKLKVSCQDAFDAIKSIQLEGGQYDIILASSFLHHIPDYLELIRQATTVLSPHGQLFSFQDPLRYDLLDRLSKIFSLFAYFSWRIFKGNIIGGLRRRIRRHKRVYIDVEDSEEYHALRGGVDQNAILSLLTRLGFECKIFPYFSTQSFIWQLVGTILGISNTFAVIAKRNLFQS